MRRAAFGVGEGVGLAERAVEVASAGGQRRRIATGYLTSVRPPPG